MNPSRGEIESLHHQLITNSEDYACRYLLIKRAQGFTFHFRCYDLFLFIGCNLDEFMCPSDNQCVPRDALCNGTTECWLYEDETECGILMY